MVYMATTWHNGSVAKHMSLPREPASCRTDVRLSRDASAWLMGLHKGAAAQTQSNTDLAPSANEVSSYFNDGHERGPIVMEFLLAFSQ